MAEAHRMLEARESRGRLLLEVIGFPSIESSTCPKPLADVKPP